MMYKMAWTIHLVSPFFVVLPSSSYLSTHVDTRSAGMARLDMGAADGGGADST